MNAICPYCNSSIGIDDVNVTADVALCRKCGETSSFAEAIGRSSPTGPDLSAPPSGVSFEQLPQGFRLGATTRSRTALFLIPFTCVWAGFSLSGLYGKQFASGHFDLFSSLFGLPFLIGSCFLIGYCAMTVAGKLEITREQDRLTVFTGFGAIGWSRSYYCSDFDSVREESRRSNNFNGSGQTIVLEGKRRVSFGTLLNEERRYFVLSVLRRMLRR